MSYSTFLVPGQNPSSSNSANNTDENRTKNKDSNQTEKNLTVQGQPPKAKSQCPYTTMIEFQ